MSLTLEQLKANRKAWVDALRSGEYAQGRGCLCFAGRYCCLGVLSSLAGIDPVGTHPNSYARAWVGLRTDSGTFNDTCLVDLNDQELMSFSEIADIIEPEPEGLFINPNEPHP